MKTLLRTSVLVVVTAACLLLVQSRVNAGMIFSVVFDDTFDSTLTPPFVGSGTLSFDDNLPDGSYLLNGLTNLAISFTFGVETFTLADLVGADPLALSVAIFNSGTDFYFDGPPSTFFGGAADFVNSNGAILSTQPNDFGPPPWNLYFFSLPGGTGGFAGTYGAVPEPGTMTLCGVFGLMAAMTAWRRKH